MKTTKKYLQSLKFIALLLVLLTFGVTCNAQTKQETLDWLNAKMPGMAAHTEFTILAKGSYLRLPTAFTNYTGSTEKWISEMHILYYSDITNIACRYSEEPRKHHQIILTGKVREYPNWKDDETRYELKTTTQYTVNSSISKNEVEKVIKALKHLATLSGATLVKDDLF